MNKTGPIDQLPMGVVWIGLVSLTYQLVKRCGQTAGRQGAKAVAVPYFQSADSHSAYRVCFFQYRVEHWGEVTWRGIDNLQYLGGRGLLLQGLARLGQQPRILDRDHRLRREILQQRDLLVGKRLDLLAIDRQHAEQGISLPQRYGEMAAGAAEIDDSAAVRVAAAVRFLIHQVEIVDDVLAGQNSRRCGPRPEPSRIAGTELGKGGRYAAHRHTVKALSVEYVEDPEGTAAQAQCLLEHHIEHGAEITRRRIDDLQHLGGRGLLLQCFARLGQEPRILHCDYCLVGKSRDECNLLVSEQFNPFARQADYADRQALAEQWYPQQGMDAALPRVVLGLVEGVGPGILDLHGAPLERGPTDDCARSRQEYQFPLTRCIRRGRRVTARPAVFAILVPVDTCVFGPAQSDRTGDNGLHDRVEIEGRSADDLQYIACRRLVFERFLQIACALPQLGDQPRVLHRDDRLRGEILQQGDLLVA